MLAVVLVRYFGILRELANKRTEHVKMDDDSSLSDLVETIATNHGSKFRAFLYRSDGKLNKSLAYAVEGDSIQPSELAKLKCKNVREFVILPPISGGT